MISTSLKRSAAVFMTPFQWIPKEPQWRNYQAFFTGEYLRDGNIIPMMRYLRNSAYVCFFGMLGALFSSTMVGFSLARLRWPGRDVVFSILIATMMLPGIVTLVPTFIIYKYLHWHDTYWPLFVPSWFGSAFYIFLVRQFLTGIPIQMDEAARIDGASSFWILIRVIIPLARPVLATVAIFSLLAHYNDFMSPLLYLNTADKFTFALGLYWFKGWGEGTPNWNYVMAASLIGLTPILVLFFVAQRQFVQSIQLTGLAGR